MLTSFILARAGEGFLCLFDELRYVASNSGVFDVGGRLRIPQSPIWDGMQFKKQGG